MSNCLIIFETEFEKTIKRSLTFSNHYNVKVNKKFHYMEDFNKVFDEAVREVEGLPKRFKEDIKGVLDITCDAQLANYRKGRARFKTAQVMAIKGVFEKWGFPIGEHEGGE